MIAVAHECTNIYCVSLNLAALKMISVALIDSFLRRQCTSQTDEYTHIIIALKKKEIFPMFFSNVQNHITATVLTFNLLRQEIKPFL